MTSRGITVVEMVVVIGLLGIVGAILIQIFVRSHISYQIQENQTTLQLETRSALDRASRAVKEAESFPSSQTVSGVAYTAATDTLILKVPSVDENQNLIANTFDYAVYTTDSAYTGDADSSTLQEVWESNGSGRNSGTKKLAETVSAFTVTYLDTSENAIGSLPAGVASAVAVRLQLVSSEVVRGKTNTADYTAQSKLRN